MLTVMLLALSALNAIVTAWTTMLDTRHPAALARALGATPRNVAAGLTAAQLLPALPGALFGIPLGLGLFAAADHGGLLTVPPAWWLAVAVLATLAVVAGLAAVPARIGARRRQRRSCRPRRPNDRGGCSDSDQGSDLHDVLLGVIRCRPAGSGPVKPLAWVASSTTRTP